jgi:ABC-type cobalamin/Fe3+-siderophores transport system ATPase subunit
MIRVVDVTHHYGVRPVLKNIIFEVQTGEVVVVVGPNGMGKTTLLGVLAGVLWPHSGFVQIDSIARRASVEGERAAIPRRSIAIEGATLKTKAVYRNLIWLLASVPKSLQSA